MDREIRAILATITHPEAGENLAKGATALVSMDPAGE